MEDQAPAARAYAPRPGDWFCDACGSSNFSHRLTCYRCGAKPPYKTGNGGGATGGWSPQTPKPGDWYCPDPMCGNLNFARRTLCNRCQTPQPGFAEGYAAAMGGMVHTMGSFGAVDYTAPMKMPLQVMPRDWQCMNCSNHNFARRLTCNRCGAHRDRNSLPMVALGMPPKALAAMTGYGMPQPPVPGRRDKPNRQDVPPELTGMQTGGPPMMLTGDWICPSITCGNLNFARRTVCNRCQTPKPIEMSSAPKTD